METESLLNQFNSRVVSNPSKIALITYEKGILKQSSYSEIERLSKAISKYILSKYDSPVVIALSSRKTLFAYAAIISCLSSKIPYVFIDYSSRSTRSRILSSLDKKQVKYALLEEEGILTGDHGSIDSDSFCSSHDEHSGHAYVMFTSGSTGDPKGVVIKRSGFSLYIDWVCKNIPNVGRLMHLALSPLHFDNSIYDLALFLNGSCVISLSFEDFQRYNKEIFKNEIIIDSLYGTPSLLRQLSKLDFFINPHIRYNPIIIGFGGEGFPWSEISRVFSHLHPKSVLINFYGPTEGTCMCSQFSFKIEEISNLAGLHESTSPVPPLGSIFDYFDYEIEEPSGELVLYGDAIMDGYISSPRDFFREAYTFVPANKEYRTGDLCFRSNDNLYILGRTDAQFKINGYRIEPEEIEWRIVTEITDIEICVFIVEDRFKYIAAIVKSLIDISSDDKLRDMIIKVSRTSLPSYMGLGDCLVVDNIPLTRSGKVNRALASQVYLDFKSQASCR